MFCNATMKKQNNTGIDIGTVCNKLSGDSMALIRTHWVTQPARHYSCYPEAKQLFHCAQKLGLYSKISLSHLANLQETDFRIYFSAFFSVQMYG